MQKYVMHNFVSSYHGQKMGVGFNLALFIFRPQLLRCFSEKEKYKTGILAIISIDEAVLHIITQSDFLSLDFQNLIDLMSLITIYSFVHYKG